VENLLLTQDFTSLQNENEKPVSGLLPMQCVSLQFVCIVILQHKSDLQIYRGVTRLDGARGKKQVWRPPCSNL